MPSLYTYRNFSGFHVLNSVIQLNMMVNRYFYVGIDVANDVAENARDTEILLNDDFFEDFSNNINNFCIFASSLPR